jgi:hypothetical protein
MTVKDMPLFCAFKKTEKESPGPLATKYRFMAELQHTPDKIQSTVVNQWL